MKHLHPVVGKDVKDQHMAERTSLKTKHQLYRNHIKQINTRCT